MNQNNEEKKGKNLPTKTMTMIRVLLGVYLVYLSYNLISSMIKGTEEMGKIGYIVCIAASILFAVVGVWCFIRSVNALRKGEYIGGTGASAQEPEEDKTEEKRITFDEEELHL